MPIKNVSVVGLGKLGLCVAAVLAMSGYNIIGVEVDKSKVDAVNKGVSPIYEPGLGKVIKANRSRLKATTSFEDAVPKTDATFVVVPTPSNESGEFSLKYVEPAMASIGKELAKKNKYHLVVLTSTVMPGSMDSVVKPTLEKSLGKACGKDFGLCYNPEFIALGDVLRGLLEPDFILVGESDKKAGDELSKIQKRICRNSPSIERMNFVNAELAKISVNSFVTMKMSFANTLAEMCERLPGGDVDRITIAIGKDKRIGLAYLKGAQGYGGPCFPRDNIAFGYYANRIGAQGELALTTHKVNVNQVQRVVDLLKRENIRPPSKVGVLGLTYKPNTNVVEASQSLMLAEQLSEEGFEVHAYDPAIPCNSRGMLSDSIRCEQSAEDCIANSDLCILATPWKEFRDIPKSKFANKIVLDCWRIFGNNGIKNATKYIAIGRGQA